MGKSGKKSKGDGGQTIASNREAGRNFFLEDRFEAGIELRGTEVKSLRAGRCSIKEAYVRPQNQELFVVGFHISPWDHASAYFNHDPDRPKRLLLHRREIDKIRGWLQSRDTGYAVVPTRVFWDRQYAKMEIALARGKKLYDKREDQKQKDDKRSMEREFARHNR